MDFEEFLARLDDPSVEHVTIVALGDSITELTWHTRGRLQWVGLLEEALCEKHGRGRIRVINAGYCGGRATQALTRMDADVLRFQPDLVIVSFGMNDAGEGPEGVQEFSDATREIIRQCREIGAAVLLRTPNPVLCSPWRAVRQDLMPGDEIPGNHQGLYAKALVEIGEETGCPVVDHYMLWKEFRPAEHKELPNTRWLRMSDEVHPGWLGHLNFYRELAPVFKLPVRFPWEE